MPLTLSYSPAGPRFEISADAEMPDITVTAALAGVEIDPRGAQPSHEWAATLEFNDGTPGTGARYGTGRVTRHTPLSAQTGPLNTWIIPFTQVRGGELTITVTVRIGNNTIRETSRGLLIIGSELTPAAIRTFASSIGANKVRFRKQMRQESELKQFRQFPGFPKGSPARWPLYSSDRLGGVGLCQITRPAPTADQTWNWKENVRAGWNLYREKERIARAYPARVRASDQFRALVREWNATERPGQPPIPIALPDFDDDQLELDTVRGFNGYAGGLHEFRVRTEQVARQNGTRYERLVVTLSPDGRSGQAEWERVPVDERGTAGDPNYVNNVEAQADF